MTKYHFIKIEYRIENQEPILFLWGRHENTLEKRLFRITGFKPRFYAPEIEPAPNTSKILEVTSGFKSILGLPCKMIKTQLPSDVRDLKQYFTKTFQADIPFTRVFLIESEILSKFTAPDKDEVHFSEIKGE